MALGRRIAFDYGDVRIGVAICDRDGILATPLVTLKTASPTLNEEIAEIISEYEPVQFFIGAPRHLSGNQSQSGEKSLSFANSISERFNIPFVEVDERLSTVSATRSMREAGKSAKESRSVIDQAAAVAILEQGLAILKNKGEL